VKVKGTFFHNGYDKENIFQLNIKITILSKNAHKYFNDTFLRRNFVFYLNFLSFFYDNGTRENLLRVP
jgi:hypothetical protein